MSTLGELYAPRFVGKGYAGTLSPEASAKMAKELGADSLRYLSVSDLADGIRVPDEHLCKGCVTGKYPTPWGNRLIGRARQALRKGRTGRTYE
jgi:amidophosphoribosyltransferase